MVEVSHVLESSLLTDAEVLEAVHYDRNGRAVGLVALAELDKVVEVERKVLDGQKPGHLQNEEEQL